MWKVGSLQPMDVPNVDVAYGFNLTGGRGRPLVTFAYATSADAEHAATQIRAAIQKAMLVKSQA
jgi:hypothetical protein